MNAKQIKVHGRVQGIGFRAIVKNYADENGIEGYVMNNEEGSVSIFARGENEKLDDFVNWINSNPGMSKVTDIKISEGKIKEKLKGFYIRKEYDYIEDKSRSFINLGKSILK